MSKFEWDDAKNISNQHKHGTSFEKAQYAFFDEQRMIIHDENHSQEE